MLGFLINGFAPLVSGLAWLKYVSPFDYYAGHDPITIGIDVFRRRDLRAWMSAEFPVPARRSRSTVAVM